MIKQTVKYGVWTVNRHEDKKTEVFKNGKLCEKSAPALREIAAEMGLEIDPEWRTSQLSRNVIKAMQGADKQSNRRPKSDSAIRDKSLEPANSELEAARAEIERLKALLDKKGKAEASIETKKIKSKDPFEELMVIVPAGMFKQYSHTREAYDVYPGGDHRRKPEYKIFYHDYCRWVTLTKDYKICKYTVTQKQWESIMGKELNKSKFRGDNLPVTNISYEDIMQFIEKLNKQTGKQYRLPTEAEWLWAAMGANNDDSRLPYDGMVSADTKLRYYAWINVNADNITHPVGQLKPNELGLYDMTGNVWECCQDRIRINLGDAAVIDPIVKEGVGHICRGGSFNSSNHECCLQRWRPTGATTHSPDGNYPSCVGLTTIGNGWDGIGFRLAL